MSTKFGENDPVGMAVAATVGVVVPEDMFDLESPRSFLSLMPEKWATKIMDARHERPDLFEMDERELYKHLKAEGKAPSAILNTLRLKLWGEYERVQANDGKRMEVFKVLGEVCRTRTLENFILTKPERAAWLMCAPMGYWTKVDESLSFGLDKLREILEMDIVQVSVDRNGNEKRSVNTKLGELQAKIVNMLDIRKHGAARQRIEQTSKSYNLNVHATAADVNERVIDVTSDDLEAQIKLLERQERAALNLPIESVEPLVADFSPSDVEVVVVKEDEFGQY
jgi:hypothetical protein